jgi:hypothetical protein
MPPASKFSGLVRMLESFIEDKAQARGTTFVREIEGEFARLGLDDEELGLDDEEEFADLRHAFAMYRGHEEDIRDLKSEAAFAIRRLATRMKKKEPNQSPEPAAASGRGSS